MSLYTIIFLFRGGTYISQFYADNEASALRKWAGNPDDEMLAGIGFADKKSSWIATARSRLEDEDSQLVPLTGLRSAWYTHILIGRSGGHINVIETMDGGVSASD